MNKKVRQAVEKRSGGLCEICKSNHLVEQHHIIGGLGKRKQCETEESVIALCWDHHHGTEGVHGKNGHELSLTLKQNLQKTYEKMGLDRTKIYQLMGDRFYD